jgi:hypothetical protein
MTDQLAEIKCVRCEHGTELHAPDADGACMADSCTCPEMIYDDEGFLRSLEDEQP